MRIVSFSPYAPSRDVKHAGGLCLYHHAATLGRDHTVVLVAPDDDPENHAALAQGPPGVAIRLVPTRPRRAGIGPRVGRHLLWLMDAPSAPRRVQRAVGADAGLWRLVRHADLVELHFDYSLQFVEQVRRVAPSTPVVAVIYELFSAALASRRRHASPMPRLEAAMLLSRARRRERSLLDRTSAVLVLADRDRQELRQLGVSTDVEVIPPWLDPVPQVPVAEREVVLFVGALWRWENVHAVDWLLRAVWPIVRRHRPAAHLMLVGADPPATLLRLRRPDVTVTGFVPELSAYYSAARCVVAPVQIGGGIQTKVPQAMLYGLPVVATVFSAQGLGDDREWGALAGVHDSPEEFARAVIDLLVDREHAQCAGDRARRWALPRWSADRFTERLRNFYGRYAA
jgi:glycosyltransferase involved in cell wall biosynthesis